MNLVSTALFATGNAVNVTARAISQYIVVPALRAANKFVFAGHVAQINGVERSIKREEQIQAALNSAMSKSHERLYLKRNAYKASVGAAEAFSKARII